MGESGFDAATYWNTRLAKTGGLRGVGHLAYSGSYNDWLYRAKARALTQALEGTTGGRALDVGSGTGWVIDRLLERGFQVEGCDATDVAVDRLHQTHPDVPVFKAVVGTDTIDREDGTYDLVTAMDVLYHIVDDDQFQAALSDLGRLLAPRGRLVVTDALGEEDHRRPGPHVCFRGVKPWFEASDAAGLELGEGGTLYRWLSRDRGVSILDRLPDGARGAVEFALESVPLRAPHMRWTILTPRGIETMADHAA